MSDDAFRLADRLALSVREAADVIGVSESHLRELLPAIPHTYLGKRVVIPVDALREWLKERAEVGRRQADEVVEDALAGLVSDRIKKKV